MASAKGRVLFGALFVQRAHTMKARWKHRSAVCAAPPLLILVLICQQSWMSARVYAPACACTSGMVVHAWIVPKGFGNNAWSEEQLRALRTELGERVGMRNEGTFYIGKVDRGELERVAMELSLEFKHRSLEAKMTDFGTGKINTMAPRAHHANLGRVHLPLRKPSARPLLYVPSLAISMLRRAWKRSLWPRGSKTLSWIFFMRHTGLLLLDILESGLLSNVSNLTFGGKALKTMLSGM